MLTELGHGQVALLLREVAVKALGIVAVANQQVGHLLCFHFRATENDGKDTRIIVYDALQRGIFILGIHHIIYMVDVLGALVARTHHDLLRVVQEVLGYLLNLATHGCREEQRVTLLGNSGQNSIDILGESHVEHLVGLIEHHVVHSIQLGHLALHQVNQSAGCGHNDVNALLQRTDLRHDIGAAIYRHHMYSLDIFGKILQVVGNLQAEFSRWTKHNGLRLMRAHVDALQERNAEGGRLASTCLCQCYNVVSCSQQVGNHFLLHGHRLFET